MKRIEKQRFIFNPRISDFNRMTKGLHTEGDFLVYELEDFRFTVSRAVAICVGRTGICRIRILQKAMPSIRQAVNDVETIRRDGKEAGRAGKF